MTESPYAQHSPGPQTPWPYAAGPRREAPTALAVATVTLAIVFTVITLASSVAAWPAAADFQDAIDDGRSTADIFTWYDGITLLLFPAMIAIYVVGCLWVMAARNNTDPAHHTRSVAWVWLGWWVPVVSFWFPYQVVRDVRDGSGDRYGTGLGLWWTAWLVMIIGDRVASNVAGNDDLVGALPYIELVNGIAAVVACALWCRIVLSITNLQKQQLTAR